MAKKSKAEAKDLKHEGILQASITIAAIVFGILAFLGSIPDPDPYLNLAIFLIGEISILVSIFALNGLKDKKEIEINVYQTFYFALILLGGVLLLWVPKYL